MMRAGGISVPFRIPDLYNGFGEAQGVARLAGDAVVLEFEVRESILNVFKGQVKEVTVPLSEVSSVEFTKSWRSARVVISCRSMRSVAGVPGMEQGRVTLSVAKADRGSAQDFETAINLWMSARALSEALPPSDLPELPG